MGQTPLTGFVVLGSNGEAAFLDEDESDRVIAAARAAVPRGRPLIAGTGRESTRATISATCRAAALGADAVLVRTPGFFKSQMTNDVFVRHYTAVADASPVPVLLYNFTAVTGVTLLPDAVTRLASHPNIIGMKESGGDVARMATWWPGTAAFHGPCRVGHDVLFRLKRAGAAGGVLALSAILPEACVRLYELAKAGAMTKRGGQRRTLVPLCRNSSAPNTASPG